MSSVLKVEGVWFFILREVFIFGFFGREGVILSVVRVVVFFIYLVYVSYLLGVYFVIIVERLCKGEW